MRIRLDDTLNFTQRIQAATSSCEICEQLLAVTRPYGLERLIAGTIPRPGLHPTATRNHILFERWPKTWLHRYVARNYADVDPVVARVTANPGSAFRWQDVEAASQAQSQARSMMGEAVEHGLAAGVAVPFVTLDGDIAALSFGGPHMDLPPVAAGLIHLVGIYAMGRAFQLQATSKPPPRVLSNREIEILKWTSVGKTAWDVSVILGIAESTVKEHLQHASAKLGTTNKVHTIAEAMRYGYIR